MDAGAEPLNPHRRAWRLALFAAAAALAFSLIPHLAEILARWDYSPWDYPRLNHTFLLARGEAVYRMPEDGGAILSTIYSPVSLFWFLPATLFERPAFILIAAQAMVWLAVFAAPAALLACAVRRGMHAPAAIVFALLTAKLTFAFSPLEYSAHQIHADAPAIGFAALACGAVLLRKRWPALFWSAFFAAAAVWTKQTLAPVLPAVIAAVWLMRGRRDGLLSAALVLAFCVVWGGVFLLIFDARALLTQMFAISPNHPWYTDSRMAGLLFAMREMLPHILLPTIFAGAFAAAEWRKRKGTWRGRLPRATPFLLLFLFSVPVALLHRAKIGGEQNAFGPPLYALLLAALTSAIVIALHTHNRRRVEQALILAAILVLIAAPHGMGLRRAKGAFDDAFTTSLDRQIALIREHRGEVWFPFNPLAHLLAEDKVYHFSYGVFDYRLAGIDVNAERLRSAMPPDTKTVLFYSEFERVPYAEYPQTENAQWFRLLPEFSERGVVQLGPGRWQAWALSQDDLARLRTEGP